jgi:ABC-type multidrug transport system fused ATPase/permease subunit
VLVSALEATRTVKLAARVPDVEAYLTSVDNRRVKAAIFEHRVRTVLDGIPILMSDSAAFMAWALCFTGAWNLATTLLVSSTAMGFVWYAIVAGAIITDAPGARSWQVATQQFAGGANLIALPAGVDLVRGSAPLPPPDVHKPFDTLQLRDMTVRYDDDGTIGAENVNLTVKSGQIVLLLGQVGSGKSAVLAALAGLRTYDGAVLWDGVPVADPELELRPGRVAYVSQIPRVVSGTIAQNIALDHARPLAEPIAIAQMDVDVAEAGGTEAMVGHRGVKLSGGQAQRLAFARALATGSAVLVADDISSALDAATELKLWAALKAHGQTVVGSTSKAAALALADQVVVMEAGQVVATGTWAELAPTYSHLAG